MKHLKGINESSYEKRKYPWDNIDKQEQYLIEIRDIFVDVSDECEVDVSVHSRQLNRISYEVNISYKIESEEREKVSINTNEGLFNKTIKITSLIYNSLKRLESLGYELSYDLKIVARKIETMSLNNSTMFGGKIQIQKIL
jgi:hypothetical protein